MGKWDVDDAMWTNIVAELRKEDWRGKEQEKRNLINTVLYLLYQSKGQFSLQLHWNLLNESDGIEYLKFAKSDSMRHTFDRWRNNGLWERLLPIITKKSKYRWLLDNGTYEVLLRSNKIVRDRNLSLKKDQERQDKLLSDEHNKELNHLNAQHKMELQRRDETISELKSTIDMKSKEIKALKNGSEVKKLKQEIEKQIREKSTYIRDNIDLKQLNRFYVRKLYHMGYDPLKVKKANPLVINNFREVLTEYNEEADD